MTSKNNFDEGEDYYCVMCNRQILDYNDGNWITPVDEQTGIEIDEETEVYCKDCF